MGNSCSSGQAHKDRDNMSQKSEESATYQVRTNVPTDKQKQVLLNHVSHSGIILEPTTAGQPPLKQHAAGVASTTTSVTSAAVDSTGTTTATATAVTTGTTTTGGSLSERRPTIAKVFKESMSLSSPPGTHSPKDFAKMDSHLPSEVANLTEQLQYLIMGRIGQAKTETRTRKIVIYVCAADSQDCCVEKGALHNKVYPELRAHCRTRGYELHIVDLHWKTLLEKQQDHEFPELCVGELTRQMEVAYVIPVLFLNNSLGTPLLPITIESADFKLAMESAENRSAQSLLSKWYQLDSDAQPPCYRLQSIAYHIPGFKETSPEERERALEEWRTEIDRTLAVLITVFSQELRDTYLTTVVEQEVHNTVFMSQELAKRCIWLNRVYTPCERTPENLNVGEIELQRRLNTLQRDLRNQLAEKHLVRLPVKYVDGGLNVDVPEHAHYIEQVVGHLSKHLREMIDSIVEEHRSKSLLKPSHGIEAALFEELNQQTSFCQKAAQCSVNREKTINEIRNYITSDRAAPLVVYGPGGCGKTTLLARVAQCCQQWVPDAFLVLRFVGISAQSSTVEQVLSSILNQCSILTYGHKNYDTHNVKTYTKSLSTVLGALGMQRRSSLILVVDGLDQVRPFSSATLEWLPATLPDNVKLVLSVNESTEMHREMARLFDADAFLEMPLLDETEARGILMSSVVQYNHSVNSKIQDCVLKSVQECTLPLYSKVLAWQTSWWADKEHDIVPKGHVNDQLKLMLEELETILGVTQVQHALAIMTGTKHGITDSEMIDLLARDETFHNATTYVKWAPACLAWSRLNKHLAPFLQWTLTGGVLGVQWRDNMLLQAVTLRYKEHTRWAHQMLFDYYAGKPCETRPDRLQARFVSQDTLLGKCYNRRKLDELPYHYHALDASGLSRSVYLTDIDWIYDKVCGSNCYQLLEDIHMAVASLGSSDADVDELNRLQLLRDFFETNAVYLNYDGRQFYAQLRYHLDAKIAAGERSLADRHVRELYERTKRPPVLTIMPMTPRAANDDGGGATTFNERRFNLITRLIGTRRFVVSIATDREEIAVWDVKKCEKVRTLTGIGHPINLIPIDKYRCIVLCRRELRIYDLNAGRFVTKLKGVMNQKMPYYGLHDRCHLVALSRNRMYVNLMNLETGDCVTTFKAGEDRFLNSLLVSGDGRVLVCGDETQKPFPLLVWSLQSKKLLYDLRIPHHDFITSLSAITHEGNYVCCVCHEIDEPNPNFIVVYDLQSGTLFKKWKPSCDTVSLEISSTGSCVVSGLEDARILVWDLITGNCRWEFAGHTAPVNLLRLDPTGFVCLSTDSEGRDRSIRVWDLNKGNLVAVFTPKANITGCELMANGRHVVLALEGHDRLVTLKLVGPDVDAEATADNDEEDEEADEEEFYGEPENDGKTFELNESDVC